CIYRNISEIRLEKFEADLISLKAIVPSADDVHSDGVIEHEPSHQCVVRSDVKAPQTLSNISLINGDEPGRVVAFGQRVGTRPRLAESVDGHCIQNCWQCPQWRNRPDPGSRNVE